MLPAFVFHGIPVVSLTCTVDKAAAVLCDGSPKNNPRFRAWVNFYFMGKACQKQQAAT